MSDLFKKPIIFELKTSYSLCFKFSIIAVLPAISLLILFEKYPFLITSLELVIFLAYVYYIRQYALRINQTSIVKIRLHRGLATIFQKNGVAKVHKMKKISLTPEWVIFIFDSWFKKIIVDQVSTDVASYSAIRREVTINKNELSS